MLRMLMSIPSALFREGKKITTLQLFLSNTEGVLRREREATEESKGH